MKADNQHIWCLGTSGKLVLAFVSLVVGLLVAELVVRLLDAAPQLRRIGTGAEDTVYQRSENPILGYELKPGYRNEDPDLVLTCDRTNSHGLRDAERTIRKPGGVQRIILLGDSVVQSIDIRNTEDVLHHQLERLYTDGKTEVFNFGVTGYCTLSEVELLDVKGLQFEPDIVVLVFVKNDFENFNMGALQLMTANPQKSLSDRLTLHSHLFRLSCAHLGLFAFQTDQNPIATNQKAIGNNNVPPGLSKLRKLADENHFQPIIAVWPDFLDDGFSDSKFMENSDELIIERLAAAQRIPCVRLSDYFTAIWKSKYPEMNPRRDWTVRADKMHLNEVGSRRAAECLYQMLADIEQHVSAAETAPSIAEDAAAALATETARTLGSDQDLAEGYRRAGILLLQRGAIAEGVASLIEALRLRPEDPDAHNELGLALERQNRYEEAMEHYLEAIRIKPEYVEAHANLASAVGRSGDYESAVEHLQEVVRLHPDDAKAHNNLGVAMEGSERLKDAISHYREATDLEPDYAKAHENLGAALARNGQFEEAAAQFQEVLRLQPDNSKARNSLRRIKKRLQPGSEPGD